MTTLPPRLHDLPPTESRQAWYLLSRLGIELYVFTVPGTNTHPNEDGFVVCEGDSVSIGIIDEVTHKVGPRSREVLTLAIQGFRDTIGSPVQRLFAGHFAIREHLDGFGERGRAGASAIALELSTKGRFRLASIGDCSALHWQRRRWWRPGGLSRLTALQRSTGGRLMHAIGMTTVPLAEINEGTLGAGDILLAGSDGIFHEALDYSAISKSLADYGTGDRQTLPQLALSIALQAKSTQPYPDDMCLALIHRSNYGPARST